MRNMASDYYSNDVEQNTNEDFVVPPPQPTYEETGGSKS